MTSASPTKRPVQIEWQLLVIMAKRKIRTITELRRRLAAIGIDISSQQLCKVANEMPDRLNTKLLAGLLTVLDCRLDDLMAVESVPAPSPVGGGDDAEMALEGKTEEEPKKKPRRRPPERDEVSNMDRALGPKVSPFPKRPAK